MKATYASQVEAQKYKSVTSVSKSTKEEAKQLTQKLLAEVHEQRRKEKGGRIQEML